MQNSNGRQLNKQDFKTLGLASLGGALEFYDFIIFVFFSGVIGSLFFPSNMPEWLRQSQTLGIFAAGYFARPLGGIIMAHFGDVVGRKRMFTFSILLMALPTLLIGLLPTYQTLGIAAPLLLLLMRICQGAAVGGEIPGAWVFVSEHVPKHKVGLACGILTAGLVIGILIGSLVSTAIHRHLDQEELLAWGWRLPFLLGGGFGFISLYLRRWLKETPIFVEMQTRKKCETQLPIKTVLTQHRQSIVISMLLTWVLSAGIMVVILMVPSYLERFYHISTIMALQANSLAIVGVGLGCVLFGRLSDKWGSGKVLIIGSLYAITVIFAFYYNLAQTQSLLYLSYIFAGLGVGIVGAFPHYMVTAFPAAVRYSGISFSFNVAYAIAGGLTPVCISLLTDFTSIMAPAYYVTALFALGVVIGITLLRRKTNFMDHE